MTIYEALGIEESLVTIPIPQDTILQNIQNSPLSWSAKSYFEVIDRVVLRASIHRSGYELQVLEINLNEPKYIQEISLLVQTAIKYRILFVFTYDDRYLIVRRNFRLTETTDHVYSEYLSYTTEWLYKENLVAEIISNYQVAELEHEDDDVFAFTSSYWKAEDAQTRFYQVFSDILNNIGQLNQCMIESDVLSLRQFCDWYIGHSAKEKLDLLSILKSIIDKSGMQYVEGTMFFDKNIIIYTIAELENSKYLRSVDHFGRHPFSYFDNITTINENEIEDVILQFVHAEPELSIEEKPANNFEGFVDDTIRKYFESVGSYSVLSAEKERILLEQMQDGDEEAREILIKSNLKLVVSIAKKYVNNGVALEDLIQEGTLGLISALEKYDTWYETRVSTYATYWIKQAMQRAIMDNNSLIRIPVHLQEDYDKIRKAQENFIIESGYEPSMEELSDKTRFSVNKIAEVLRACETMIVGEDVIDEFGAPVLDSVVDEKTPSLCSSLLDKIRKETIEQVLETLTPREKHVIKLRFGFYDGKVRSLEEVGQEFEITREIIRQIEAKALRKLRHPSRARKLKGLLDIEDDLISYCRPVREDYSISTSSFLDEIIRRYSLRGYRILEELPLRTSTVMRARRHGYQVLEQFANLSFDDLKLFTTSMKIEIILCMESFQIRLADCSIEEYLNIADYLRDKIKCEHCGKEILDSDWTNNDGYCFDCQIRMNKIAMPMFFASLERRTRMTGKEKCELLKAMRREIAEANGIIYLSAECTYEGDCPGYCPKCDAESRYLDAELNRLAREGRELKITNFAYQSVIHSELLSDEQSVEKTTSHVGSLLDEAGSSKERVLAMRIEELDMSVRSFNCLKCAGIDTVGDLTERTYTDLSNVRNLGHKNVEEVVQHLHALGLDLKKDDDEDDSPVVLGRLEVSKPLKDREYVSKGMLPVAEEDDDDYWYDE